MELKSDRLVITREELAAFCGFASRDETRAHLASVAIDLKKGYVAATDGHRLLLWSGDACGDREILLSAHSLRSVLSLRERKTARSPRKRLAVAPAKPAPSLTLAFGEHETRVELAGMAVVIRNQSGLSYPPVLSVVPKYKTGEPCSCVAVNPFLFTEVARVAKIVNSQLPGVIVQPGPTDLDPILLKFSRDPRWTCVLMPMRMGGTYDASRKVAAAE